MIQHNANQNPSRLNCDYLSIGSKVFTEIQKLQIANILLKKNQVVELVLPDFKTCYKVQWSKQGGIGKGIKK